MKFVYIMMIFVLSGCVSMHSVDKCEQKVGGSPIELDGTTLIFPVEMSVGVTGIWSTFRTIPEVCLKDK